MLLCMAAVSCSIVPAPESAETVDVELRIGVDGGGLETGSGAWTKAAGSKAETDIHSLRVIACATDDDGSVSVVYRSEKITTFTMNSGQPHVVLTVPKVPAGSVTFYVVANEDALGQEVLTDEVLTDEVLAKPAGLSSLLYIDNYQLPGGGVERNVRFPIDGFGSQEASIATNGLPMSGLTTVEVTSGMNPVTVNLERMVAKVLVQVENAISEAIVMKNRIVFTNFVGDRTYLFPEAGDGGRGDVPDDVVDYKSLNTENPDDGTSIEGTTTCEDFYTAYILPRGGTRDRELSLTLYREDGTSCTGTIPGNVVIPRNTQMTILAQINEKVGISISFEVLPWKAYNINVPVFD